MDEVEIKSQKLCRCGKEFKHRGRCRGEWWWCEYEKRD